MGVTADAMLPKQARGTFRKYITKPSEQVAAPPSRIPDNAMNTKTKQLIYDIFSSLFFIPLK